jgi:hypothetical protein
VTAVSRVEIYGVQETLKALNEHDRLLRRQITKDIQGGAGRKLVTAGRELIPTSKINPKNGKAAPLTGMTRGGLIGGREGTGWDVNRVLASIVTVVGQRARKERTVQFSNGNVARFNATPYQLLVLRQKDAAGAIWDHAGINKGGAFVSNLVASGDHVGSREQPRAMKPAAEATVPAIEAELVAILDRVNKILNRNLIVERRG